MLFLRTENILFDIFAYDLLTVSSKQKLLIPQFISSVNAHRHVVNNYWLSSRTTHYTCHIKCTLYLLKQPWRLDYRYVYTKLFVPICVLICVRSNKLLCATTQDDHKTSTQVCKHTDISTTHLSNLTGPRCYYHGWIFKGDLYQYLIMGYHTSMRIINQVQTSSTFL